MFTKQEKDDVCRLADEMGRAVIRLGEEYAATRPREAKAVAMAAALVVAARLAAVPQPVRVFADDLIRIAREEA